MKKLKFVLFFLLILGVGSALYCLNTVSATTNSMKSSDAQSEGTHVNVWTKEDETGTELLLIADEKALSSCICDQIEQYKGKKLGLNIVIRGTNIDCEPIWEKLHSVNEGDINSLEIHTPMISETAVDAILKSKIRELYLSKFAIIENVFTFVEALKQEDCALEVILGIDKENNLVEYNKILNVAIENRKSAEIYRNLEDSKKLVIEPRYPIAFWRQILNTYQDKIENISFCNWDSRPKKDSDLCGYTSFSNKSRLFYEIISMLKDQTSLRTLEFDKSVVIETKQIYDVLKDSAAKCFFKNSIVLQSDDFYDLIFTGKVFLMDTQLI